MRSVRCDVQMAGVQHQREDQLGELLSVRSTFNEQTQRQTNRLRRKQDHSSAAAGDLDEDGEFLLRERVRLSMAQKQASRTALLAAVAREKELRSRMHRLQSVSGGGRPDEILQQLDSQRDFRAALHLKLTETEAKKANLEALLNDLVRQRESLFEEVPERGSVVTKRSSEQIYYCRDQLRQRTTTNSKQNQLFSRLGLVLVEAKDGVRRICCRLAEVPDVAQDLQLAVPILSSDTIDTATLLSEMDRLVHELMKLFATAVPVAMQYALPSFESRPRPWVPAVSPERSFSRLSLKDLEWPETDDGDISTDDETASSARYAQSPSAMNRDSVNSIDSTEGQKGGVPTNGGSKSRVQRRKRAVRK